MAKAIQIRDVPDGVHAVLAAAADERNTSLTAFLQSELAELARRLESVAHNERVIAASKAAVGAPVSTDEILAALHSGRDDR